MTVIFINSESHFEPFENNKDYKCFDKLNMTDSSKIKLFNMQLYSKRTYKQTNLIT